MTVLERAKAAGKMKTRHFMPEMTLNQWAALKEKSDKEGKGDKWFAYRAA